MKKVSLLITLLAISIVCFAQSGASELDAFDSDLQGSKASALVFAKALAGLGALIGMGAIFIKIASGEGNGAGSLLKWIFLVITCSAGFAALVLIF